MQTSASVEIDRPIDEVFAYTTGQVASWSTIVVEETPVEDKPGVVGSRFRVVTEDRGCRMTFDGVVTRHEPPTLSEVQMTGQRFDMRVVYRFEQAAGKTRVTQDSTVTGKGMVKVMFVLLGWAMRKSGCNAAAQELANLKRLLEQGAGKGEPRDPAG